MTDDKGDWLHECQRDKRLARIAELEAELDAERKRRWDGNRVASDEHRAEVLALRAERDRLRERVYDLNLISMSLAADLLRFIGEDESREADCLRARIVGWRRQWDEISTRAALQEGSDE